MPVCLYYVFPCYIVMHRVTFRYRGGVLCKWKKCHLIVTLNLLLSESYAY